MAGLLHSRALKLLRLVLYASQQSDDGSQVRSPSSSNRKTEDFALFHRSFRQHAGVVHQGGTVWGSLFGYCWRR